MTQFQIQCLPTRELKAILSSTNHNSSRFAQELLWAKDEMASRTSADRLSRGLRDAEDRAWRAGNED